MITNDTGEIAIAYHQPADAFIDESRVPSRTGYAFSVRRGSVSMAWIKPEDADTVLAIRGGCCGQRKRIFAYATEGQVGMWVGAANGAVKSG